MKYEKNSVLKHHDPSFDRKIDAFTTYYVIDVCHQLSPVEKFLLEMGAILSHIRTSFTIVVSKISCRHTSIAYNFVPCMGFVSTVERDHKFESRRFYCTWSHILVELLNSVAQLREDVRHLFRKKRGIFLTVLSLKRVSNKDRCEGILENRLVLFTTAVLWKLMTLLASIAHAHTLSTSVITNYTQIRFRFIFYRN